MTKYYILSGHEIEETDLITWAKSIEGMDRTIGDTRIGTARVSTVFLGLDHRFGEDGPPILFETMCFNDDQNDPLEDDCERYCTWDQAEAGHSLWCAKIKERQTA